MPSPPSCSSSDAPSSPGALEPNSPDSLVSICADFCVRHPETLCCHSPPVGPSSGKLRLRPGLSLPSEICEGLLTAGHRLMTDDLLGLFGDPANTRLRRVNLRNSPAVSDLGLESVLKHSLTELDVSGCPKLTERALELINDNGQELLSLVIGNSVHILPETLVVGAACDEDTPRSTPFGFLLEDPRRGSVGSEPMGFRRAAAAPSRQRPPTRGFIMNTLNHLAESMGVAGEEATPPLFELAEPPARRRGFVLNTPNLRRLVISSWEEPLEAGYLSHMFRPLGHLTHLDLSQCGCLGALPFLAHLGELVSLVLYGVPGLQEAVPFICQLKKIRHLDISQYSEKLAVFSSPNHVLAQIVHNLPQLSSLDISGTNLAGTGVAESSDIGGDEPNDNDDDGNGGNGKIQKGASSAQAHHPTTDIPGLRGRVSRPLDFLGLLNTSHDACLRHHIPARRITGDANEEQILTAARVYGERADVMQKVLNDLFRLFRYESCRSPTLALKLILQAMQNHISEKHIQVSGSASLFYIVKGDDRSALNVKVKKSIVKALLDAMCEHKADSTMMRNGCLTLCNFRIPQDVLFDYGRLVDIVLHIVSVESQEEFVQRIGIYLLNSLACQVEGSQKQLVGELGAIETMLKLIEKRLQRQSCDEVMEIAWSTMWNVTDETPANCKRFLDGKGMEYFLMCLQAFPNKPELLRNMMGLLGNVAEVESLRSALMTPEYLTVFRDLLESSSSGSEGIEVSYNAAGVLAHLASEGERFWSVRSPSRRDVLRRMSAVVGRWDVAAKRNINYRSFEPIFRLLRAENAPEAQHWAIWALANLTRVYPNKYCPLVKEEGGLEMVRELFERHSAASNGQREKEEEEEEEEEGREKEEELVRGLAHLVLTQCESYEKYGTLEGDMEGVENEDEGRV